MRLLSKIFATSASVVPNASAKPAMSANEGWLIASGWFGCDLMLKSCASGQLSRRLRYRSMTARCRGVGVASAASAEPCASLLLFITATNVRTGRGHVFKNGTITPDVLLASACLPTMFQAIEIDGEPYWDGGYSGNPTITPLIRECKSCSLAAVVGSKYAALMRFALEPDIRGRVLLMHQAGEKTKPWSRALDHGPDFLLRACPVVVSMPHSERRQCICATRDKRARSAFCVPADAEKSAPVHASSMTRSKSFVMKRWDRS